MNSSLLLSSAFTGAQTGPMILGVDVVWAGTMLAAVGVFAVLFAIYNALTVRNPMTKRVKALNERREQLKAGILTPPGALMAFLNDWLLRHIMLTDKRLAAFILARRGKAPDAA